MGKRYVFWRGPDAKPNTSNDGRFVLHEILAVWGKATEVNQQGGLQWNLLGPNTYEEALKMAIAVIDPSGKEVEEGEAWHIVQKALRAEALALGGKTPIAAAKLIHRADAVAAKHFQTKASRYVLLTSLSVGAAPAKVIHIEGCVIRFLLSRNGYRLPKVLSEMADSNPYRAHLNNTKYQWIAISVEGRTQRQAVLQALTAVNLLRSLWTLTVTYGRKSIGFGGLNRTVPLSVVHSGPVHILYHSNRRPAQEDLFWRQPDPRGDRDLFRPSIPWSQLEKQRRAACRLISTLPYQKEMIELMVRYVAALDQTDHDLAFLQMWSILEKVTDTIGGKYEETIKRATWLWPNRSLGREVLECIRIQRNRYVHASRSTETPDETAYLIKSVLEPLLLHLLQNSFKIGSIRDFAEVLAMPVEPTRLKELRRRITMAERIHSPAPVLP